jgi:hypothetical protein
MLYFKTLPKMLSPDENGNIIVMTNIMVRAKLLEQLQNNPMLFYTYSIQEGDTPEIVADKYYGDSYRYWIVLYSNQVMDPLWDWPLNYNEFDAYLNNKYKTEAEAAGKPVYEYVRETVQEYQKIVTTTDSDTQKSTVNIYSLSFSEYNSLMLSTNTYLLPNGLSCTIQIDKNIQYIYDYEVELNEKKREIKILNSSYAADMENELYRLMRK